MEAAPSLAGAVSSTQFPVGSGSWNPRVSCSSPWIVRITDITNNMTGSSSLSNSIFNPGITSPVGTAKRWLAPGSTPAGWVSPGPPCTITNSHGQVSVFVEIDGVKRGSIANDDCTGTYDPVNGGTSNGGNYCDTDFNIYDPAVVPTYSSSCSNSSDKTCYGRIHIEIDHDWKAARYCGASTACDDAAVNSQTTSSSVLDVQGYVYWDPGQINQQWHSFNGWEIHPVTGWRFHQSTPPSPDFSTSANPSSLNAPLGSSASSTITLSSLNGFTGTVSLSATSSPSGPSLSLNPTSVTLSSGGTASSSLSVSSSTSGSYTITVTGTSGSLSHSASVNLIVADFRISANPSSITIAPGSSATSSISLTSTGGFTGTVSLSSTVSPSGPTASLNPASVSLSSSSTGTSTLTFQTQPSTPTGTYTVTVTGSSGSLSHSTTVSVSVAVNPDFSISADPSSFTLSRSSTDNSTITITSLNGFSGTISLSTSISPSGPRTTLSSSTLTLTSGGSATSILGIRTLKKTHFGTYTITVTATSGSTSHSTTITLTVVA